MRVLSRPTARKISDLILEEMEGIGEIYERSNDSDDLFYASLKSAVERIQVDVIGKRARRRVKTYREKDHLHRIEGGKKLK